MHFPSRTPSPSPTAPRLATGGFTILEVMMAAIVMVLGIVTSLTALQVGSRAVDTARNTTLAAQIIQSEMEILRLQNWAQISALPASATVDPSTSISSGSTSSLDILLNRVANRFTCTRSVDDIAGRSDIKRITLTAVWNGVDGRRHSATYQTRYAKNGLSDYFYVSR